MEIEKAKYATLGKYVLVQNLGSGFNSKVKLGVHMETDQKVAVKILKDVFNKFISNEIETLSKINHPNIVNLVEFLPNVDYIKKNGTVKKVTAIVLELAPGGEVFEFLFRTGRFSEGVSRFFFHKLIDSLEYIHGQGYSHRDLKPENLLFGESFVLKLADFGFSTLVSGRDGKGFLHTYLGTKGYMAPEIIAKSPYNGVSVDIFASAVILFIMFTGIPPFPEAQPNDPYYKMIVNNRHDIFWHAHSRNKPAGFFSAEFKDLMNALFSRDPANRPTIEAIKTHAWFNGPTPSEEDVRLEMEKRYVTVQTEMEKERLQKKILAQQKKAAIDKKPAGGMLMQYPGPPPGKGVLDSLGAEVKDLEGEFNLTLERKVAEYNPREAAYRKEYICSDNVKNSLIGLLSTLKKSNFQDIKLHEKSFKISASFGEERDLKIAARIYQGEENTSYIAFERKEGSTLRFDEICQGVFSSLDKIMDPKPESA